MSNGYKISYTVGHSDTDETFGAIMSVLREQYPEAVAYDERGWSVGDDASPDGRVLVWEDEIESENDDGSAAIAEINPIP